MKAPSLGIAQWLNVVGVAAIHAGAALAVARGATASLAGLAAATFAVRMFAITAGYHRYFAHRSFKTSRAFALALAVVGATCAQKGPLWWASIHRAHHKHADRAGDVHTPLHGLWHAHAGWWLGRDHERTRIELVADLARRPELVWLDRWHALGSAALVGALLAIGGLDAVLWGYGVSTFALHHVVFSINSVTHRWGRRAFDTPDESRNCALLGIVGLGEGWHNNHHHAMSSARFGLRWWEVDLGWLGLRALAAAGLVWDLRR